MQTLYLINWNNVASGEHWFNQIQGRVECNKPILGDYLTAKDCADKQLILKGVNHAYIKPTLQTHTH